MRTFLLAAMLLLTIGLSAQDERPTYQNPQTSFYLVAGATGYELAESRPSGPEVRLGFFKEAGAMILHGAVGYNSYYEEGNALRFINWEGGIGAYVMKGFAITANLSYYTQRGPGNVGAYGIVLRPIIDLVEISDRFDVMVTGGISFTDNFMGWSGQVGVKYKLQ